MIVTLHGAGRNFEQVKLHITEYGHIQCSAGGGSSLGSGRANYQEVTPCLY
jgi:hypothetical protein